MYCYLVAAGILIVSCIMIGFAANWTFNVFALIAIIVLLLVATLFIFLTIRSYKKAESEDEAYRQECRLDREMGWELDPECDVEESDIALSIRDILDKEDEIESGLPPLKRAKMEYAALLEKQKQIDDLYDRCEDREQFLEEAYDMGKINEGVYVKELHKLTKDFERIAAAIEELTSRAKILKDKIDGLNEETEEDEKVTINVPHNLKYVLAKETKNIEGYIVKLEDLSNYIYKNELESYKELAKVMKEFAKNTTSNFRLILENINEDWMEEELIYHFSNYVSCSAKYMLSIYKKLELEDEENDNSDKHKVALKDLRLAVNKMMSSTKEAVATLKQDLKRLESIYLEIEDVVESLSFYLKWRD